MSQVSRRDDNPAHTAFMRDMREHLRANNTQVATLTTSMAHMTDKLSEFVTAVELMRQTQEQHAKAIDGIIEREQSREKLAGEHRFTVSNNIVFWGIGAISLILGLISAVNIFAAHWH